MMRTAPPATATEPSTVSPVSASRPCAAISTDSVVWLMTNVYARSSPARRTISTPGIASRVRMPAVAAMREIRSR